MSLDWISVTLAEYPLAVFAVAGAMAFAAGRMWRRPGTGGRARAFAGGVALFAYAALATWYVSLGTYADHAEPTIPATAWSFWNGAPLYHAADAGPRYSLIYGPVLYEAHAAALFLLGPSIVTSKVLGVVAAFGAIVLTWIALSGRASAQDRLALTGAMAVAALAFRNASFWTRAEPLLMVTCAASLVAATRTHGWWRWSLLGICAAVAFGLKATGPVYLLPALALAWPGSRHVHVAGGIILAVAVVGVSYLAPGVSAANHWYWFHLAMRNGLRRVVLVQNVQYAVLFSAAALAGALARRTREARAVSVSTTVALVFVAVAASKPGGGAYHLVPLLPAVMFAAAPAAPSSGAPALVFRATFAALLVIAIAQQLYYLRRVIPADGAHADLDVSAFLDGHPRASVAVGYGGAYRWSFARPVPVFAGRSPYLLDAAAVMELELSGVALPPATIDLVSSCAVNYWLVPSGGPPFSLPSAYTGREVFPEAFRAAFHRRYRREGSTRLFDVWQCATDPGGIR